jgi:hypothetical protein
VNCFARPPFSSAGRSSPYRGPVFFDGESREMPSSRLSGAGFAGQHAVASYSSPRNTSKTRKWCSYLCCQVMAYSGIYFLLSKQAKPIDLAILANDQKMSFGSILIGPIWPTQSFRQCLLQVYANSRIVAHNIVITRQNRRTSSMPHCTCPR